MKKTKTKFITLALASAFIAVGYSTVASADSVTSSDKTADTNSTLTITPRMNVEVQGGGFSKAHKLVFIRKDGPGSLYYDYTIRKYVWIQTEASSTAVINTVIQGLAGSVGGGHFVIEKK